MAENAIDTAGNNMIQLRFVGHNSNEVNLLGKLDGSMDRFKKAYAVRTGVDEKSLRLFFNGDQLNDEDTPRSLQLKDNNIIYVYRRIMNKLVDNSTEYEYIKVLVVRENSNDVQVRIRKDTSLEQMMNKYAKEFAKVDVSTLSFFFNDHQIKDEDTPLSLQMRENDVIKCNLLFMNKTTDDVTSNNSDYIRLKVVRENSEEVGFHMKKGDGLGKLMKRYSDCVNIDSSSLRFFFGETKLKIDHTAIWLKMEEGDTIRACYIDNTDIANREPGLILINVVDQHMEKVRFLMKKDSSLGRLKKLYLKQVKAKIISFIFKEHEINHSDTPESLQMVDNDVIHAVLG